MLAFVESNLVQNPLVELLRSFKAVFHIIASHCK